MQGRNKRPVLMFALILGSMILLTLTLVNKNVNISGVAIVNASEEPVNNEPPPDQPVDEPTTETQQDIPQVADENFVPTEIPATSVPPTPLPTSVPTENPAEVTEIPTSAPEATELPQPTDETTPEVEITPETTSEFLVPPEVTSEATAEFSQFDVLITCSDAGTTFDITNIGADMIDPETYAIDSVELGQVLLAQGETTSIQADYGMPLLSLAGSDFQSETSCNPPPQLTITMECTLDAGATFFITNSGAAMQTEQPYTLTLADGDSIGSFQLGEGEYIEIPAGYGTPSLVTGDLQAQFDPVCAAPGHIQGHIWNDANGDGFYAQDESSIPGIMVELLNSDGFPVSAVILEDGSYEFFPVSEGNYTLRAALDMLPSDLQNTVDPDGTTDSQTSLTVLSGETYTLDFGYAVVATASVSGNVWLETSNFGTWDSGETGLIGVIVQLVDANGLVVQETVIDTDGAYHFEALIAGSYTVRMTSETLPQPFGVTYNSDGNHDLETAVTVESGQTIDSINFGIVGTF